MSAGTRQDPATRDVGLIWAQSSEGVIGRDGTLPWHLPEDLAHFREVTGGHCVVMGRATWQSLPERFRPLPGRRNLVLSRDTAFQAPGAEVFDSLHSALDAASSTVWVLGGGTVYAQAVALADRLEVTEVDLAVDGDTHAPVVDDTWKATATDPDEGWHTSRTGLRYRFVSYRRTS